ncbi:hypothetical protein O0544_15665 [Edwardsiella anguillarum]|nr:hypothetical protein [Edwardsiella anguillarum]
MSDATFYTWRKKYDGISLLNSDRCDS